MTFEQALIEKLAEKPKLTRQERRIEQILSAPDSPRRRRQLARMERRVRNELGYGGADEVDWKAELDWNEIFKFIMEILAKLLPLLLAL